MYQLRRFTLESVFFFCTTDQRPGKPHSVNKKSNSWTQENTRPSSRGLFRGESTLIDFKTLKEKSTSEVVHSLNEGMTQLKFFLESEEEQHNSDEFTFDLTCTLAVACEAPPTGNKNEILVALKGSAFFTQKIPRLLGRVEASMTIDDDDSRRRLFQCLLTIFTTYLSHLPNSYGDLRYDDLKKALIQSKIAGKEELQKELEAFKLARDHIIKGERHRYGKRYTSREGEKPPNDFRDIPICPTNEEMTTQERPPLSKNISKGKYKNAEHYLDVQFRLLREDFLEPLREGIHEIVQNIPRPQRKQLMKSYRNVRIFDKIFTWSGIIHQAKIDVSGLDTSGWVNSKRLMFGSFLCLSPDNFKTMLFATVAEREPAELKEGRVKIRFIEQQDVLGIENRHCVYQMVESPAYFEAYRHVLTGLKKLDEKTLPFKRYLVECNAEVDPPEYLRRHDTQTPVCYDLSKALHIRDASNAKAVPVLQPEAWPPVEALPLNSSQLEALRTALTTEFSVIQGPPGTGKTYVGAKIVRCLLANRTAWDPARNSPMLMVCYTNHALDQFLEKVLEFLPSQCIIRVGGRSKSEKLVGCNLRRFTHRFRLQNKREEVDKKMRQNDSEMKKWKGYLAKADKQLLLYDDLEEVLSPPHADQLCNAIFPSNVANESRTPANTFQLWLCDNKLVGSCNQNTLARTEDKTVRSPDGSILEEIGGNENDELVHVATLPRAPQHAKENSTKKIPKSTKRDSFTAMDISNEVNNTCPEQKEDLSEQKELKESYHTLPGRLFVQKSGSSLEEQLFSNVPTPSLDDGGKLDSTTWKMVELKEVADSIQGTEDPHAEKKTGEAENENIEIEREVDIIQHQRCVQGDEDLLRPISEQKEEIVSQQKDDTIDDGWTTVTHKKRRNPFFWQKKGENTVEESKHTQVSGVGDEDDRKKTKSSKKKTRKKNKNKNFQIKITGDITTLEGALKRLETMTTDEAMGVDNIWNLSQSDRLRLYLFWIENYRERYRVEIHRGEQEYQQLCEELEALTFEEEEDVIRRATVVGMTTSGAARYYSMLQRVAPKIVVIEEAAEVMEAHIVTSLSHNTKHTILIGDHKQLRPKAAVYELAQTYNLEVSLFERMVMNSMECKRLSIQHRMRPEIAALTKRIYDHEIVDHESVCRFRNISGVSHNLFFIDHCQPEKLVEGLQSYSNQHEAAFLVELCYYLLHQGYERNQITVLTMYTGQLLLLQKMMPKRTFEGVKVCAVDNFQGEENEIILLSLVRSNSDGNIGFLRESNRICVALSRARQGFYCIGNFSLLKSQSKLWKEICNDLQAKGAIGISLQLVCKRHNNSTIIRWPSEFRSSILGGCTKPCGDRLDCGHACDKPCHALDWYHRMGCCSKMCSNFCPNNHRCPLRCHYPSNCFQCHEIVLKTLPWCGHQKLVVCTIDPGLVYCHELVLKTLPWCGHQKIVECSSDPGFVYCELKCKKILKCGHNCQTPCGSPCTMDCTVPCKKTLPCGHEKIMFCHVDPKVNKQCNNKCTKVLDCGHPCSRRCTESCQCDTEIDVKLVCEHTKRILCRKKDYPVHCNEKCKRSLDCGHECPRICHEDCRMRQCKINVVKDLPCGHQQSAPCCQDPRTVFCNAPCPRQLDCGHKCLSVCGFLCQEVQCKELCQVKCERGHSCQRRCHFGSLCYDCVVEVTITIPACGHSIKVPCCVDLATLKCKQPCERVRDCGHPCQEICSKKCETQPCKVRVPRTLSCDHVVTLECHENHEKFICKKKIEVHLPCGHKTCLECHVAKAGLENVLCKTLVKKELLCNHRLTLPCHKNPEECICRKKVNVELPCGHTKSLRCSIVTAGLPDVNCTVKVPITLSCGHEANLPCHVKPREHLCDQVIEITLSCGHNKLTKCTSARDELQGRICETEVTQMLPCGHEKKTPCSVKPDDACCDAPCERFLSCGHPCPNKCGDDCLSFKCAVEVEKSLSCGYHKVSCLCSEDVSQIICSSQCTRQLKCGHLCPGKCCEDCSQYICQKMVVKNLNCAGNHSKKMCCSDDPSGVACQGRCNGNLSCGHPCPGLCSQPCQSMKCRREVEKTFPCGHKEKLQCLQFKTATCKAPCRRRKKCKHKCKGVCGESCSSYPCDVAVVKTLPCDHKITMPCSYSVDDVQCPAPCGAKLPCGHQCSGTCNDCRQRSSHELCQHQCSRILVCSHRCQAICSKPCPPCNRKCGRRCPHGKCTERCLQPCNPCRKPCTWSCPHYQCNDLCGEECQRPPCNAPCPKKLACRHPCIGLCGENCPTVCGICHAKKLSSILGDKSTKVTEDARYLQLFDCGHLLTVTEMDAWMRRQLDSDVQLIQCPRCSTAITFSYRYGNIVKKTLKNIEKVKTTIRELGNETASFARHLVKQLRRPSKGIHAVVELSTNPESMTLDKISPLRIPLIFTLKNHLIIMHQIEKAQHSLRTLTTHPAISKGQLEIKQYSDSITHALEKITEYLDEPQLDLKTLDKVHEHTRKFALFALILEVQSEAVKRQWSFTSIAEDRLKRTSNEFNLFLQGNNDALDVDWLERIVALLREEVNLAALPREEPTDFENFPGFGKGVWKLCKHGQVHFSRSIVRDGEDVTVVSNSCKLCVHEESD